MVIITQLSPKTQTCVLLQFHCSRSVFGLSSYVASETNWIIYINDLLGTCTALLVVDFSFTAAWVFGREYSDRTISEILVKPASKLHMVLVKFVAIFLWDMLLSFFMFAVLLLVGLLLRLNDFSWSFVGSRFFSFLGASFMIMASSTIMAFLANVTKGYLAPIGLTFLIVIVSNIVTGYFLFLHINNFSIRHLHKHTPLNIFYLTFLSTFSSSFFIFLYHSYAVFIFYQRTIANAIIAT